MEMEEVRAAMLIRKKKVNAHHVCPARPMVVNSSGSTVKIKRVFR